MIVAAYAISGLCAAVTGVLFTGFSTMAFLGMGDQFVLPAIAAVVLGGASIYGGRRCDVAPIAKSYLLDDYLADAANQNVVKSVHVDAGFDPSQPVAETRWLQSIANQRGFPHGVVARAELHRSDVETMLAAHCRFPNVRGIRHIVNWHPDPAKTYVTKPDFLTDPAWLRGFARLKRYNLSFDLQLYPSQMGGRRGACRGGLIYSWCNLSSCNGIIRARSK